MEGSKRKPDFRLRTQPAFWRWLWSCALFCLSAIASAETSSVQVILSSDASHYEQVASKLSSVLEVEHPDLDIHVSTWSKNAPFPESKLDSRLLIAIGTSACDASMHLNDSRPLICTFLPRSAFQTLRQEHTQQPSGRQISAIYLDQPLARYLALIHTLVPKAKHLGTAVGPHSKELLPEIETLSTRFGLELHSTEISAEANPVATLTPIVEASDVFLANPDQAKFSRVTAKWLLYLSIRQRIPVIAFSKAYVNAGALAAVYSSPEDIGHDTGESVGRWLKQTDQPLEPERYPNYFSVRTNPNVARALSIHLPAKGELDTLIKKELNGLP